MRMLAEGVMNIALPRAPLHGQFDTRAPHFGSPTPTCSRRFCLFNVQGARVSS